MTAILAVETSTLTASVALRIGEEKLIERESGVNTHAEVLLDLIDQCLKEAGLGLGELDAIAVGAGPGSFTGLRIGMATVKGLCFATGVPLRSISSLAALHEDCRGYSEGNTLMVPVLDARRKEVFVSFYRDGHAFGIEHVVAPGELAALVKSELRPGEEVLLFGDGATKYRESFVGVGRVVSGCRQTPSAAAVARLAEIDETGTTLASAAPSYVRLPEVQLKFPDGNPGGTFASQKPTKG